MSSSASASSYWRVAGMSYLKYSGLAADMVRASLKEPFKSKAKLREAVYFKSALWKDGQQQQQGKLPLTLQKWAVHTASHSCGIAVPHTEFAHAVITDLTPPEAIQKK